MNRADVTSANQVRNNCHKVGSLEASARAQDVDFSGHPCCPMGLTPDRVAAGHIKLLLPAFAHSEAQGFMAPFGMACDDQVVGTEPAHFKAHFVAGVDRQLLGLEDRPSSLPSSIVNRRQLSSSLPTSQPCLCLLTCGAGQRFRTPLGAWGRSSPSQSVLVGSPARVRSGAGELRSDPRH